MNDPLFAVPLSALVYFEPYGTEFHWTCTLPGGSGGYDLDGYYVVCDRRIDASSEAAARAAAVAHLGSVHGIREAGEPEAFRLPEWITTRVCSVCNYTDVNGFGPNDERRYWATDVLCVKCYTPVEETQ